MNWGCLFVAFVLIASMTGCNKGPARPPVYPVSGEFFVKGQPAAGARLTLHPVENAGPERFPLGHPTALVEADGKFHFQTYAEKDGAPGGKYKLLARWETGTDGQEEDPDAKPRVNQIDASYSEADKSTWTVEVQKKPNTLQRYDVP
jgi:hypothetical protein